MKPTLLILAAGMGSRYGGLKQLDQMGPNGETIMDYSVKYALESGYGKVVFVIRRSMEADFKKYVMSRYEDKIPVQCVFQELDMLPEGFSVHPERKKPYGTAHAILVAKEAVKEPFTVINADDFYGREAFEVMADFLKNAPATELPTYSMVGYRLDKTLSEHGTVSRGVCSTDEQGFLKTIVENRKIGYTENGIENNEENLHNFFKGDEPVSMNFWGFTPDFFDCLNGLFVEFLNENQDNITAEFPIPNVVSYLMNNGKARVKVLHSNAEWFGVTYQEDRPAVVAKLAQLNMIPLENYPYSDAQIQERIAEYTRKGNPYMDEQQAYRFILNCIDLTTLEGSDNRAVVEALCQRAIDFKDDARNIKSTAAVCVYPPFASIAKEKLKGTDIHVACVAGAFPAGQSPIEVKLAEVRYALEQGADEIDMVISRGKFLEGNYQEVYDEIKAIREACSGARLKVILETGELKTADNIYKASQLAIAAGADFIKTSTGKIAVNATPESFLVMLDAIKAHYEKTGKMVSMKPAGGISDPETALQYVSILANVLGEKWMDNSHFRIGASRLANKVLDKIQ